MKTAKHLLAVIIMVISFHSIKAQTYQPNWESIDSRPVPAWFEDAKLGIFELGDRQSLNPKWISPIIIPTG